MSARLGLTIAVMVVAALSGCGPAKDADPLLSSSLQRLLEKYGVKDVVACGEHVDILLHGDDTVRIWMRRLKERQEFRFVRGEEDRDGGIYVWGRAGLLRTIPTDYVADPLFPRVFRPGGSDRSVFLLVYTNRPPSSNPFSCRVGVFQIVDGTCTEVFSEEFKALSYVYDPESSLVVTRYEFLGNVSEKIQLVQMRYRINQPGKPAELVASYSGRVYRWHPRTASFEPKHPETQPAGEGRGQEPF